MVGIKGTSSQTIRQLLGNGLRYEVPKFQRDYSWDTEQWSDLWDDMQAVMSGEEPGHYLGYLVLQTSNEKQFQIIDGQQRLTTFSLIILATLRILKELIDESGDEPDPNKVRLDTLRASYIGYLNPVTLISESKLTLNRNNDRYYQNYLVLLEQLPQRNINASERLMRRALLWFKDRIAETYMDGEQLAIFIDTIVDKLYFTVINVSDELNAFKVFETLNARGVQLSSADLLKNYLFSLIHSAEVHDIELSQAENLWNGIVEKLGGEKFPTFLRTYWNSHYAPVRATNLFKAIRKHVSDKASAFDLIRKMDRAADVFMALKNPYDELWNTRPAVKGNIMLLKLFQVRQPYGVLIAGYEDLTSQEFERLLHQIVIISFRYNIIGSKNPKDQERIYSDLAQHIRHENNYSFSQLRNIYPEDADFKVDFINTTFKRSSRNHKIVRYIFTKIERQQYHVELAEDDPLYTIEHILPENPEEGWEHFDDDAIFRNVYRLGNLSLIEKNLNKEAGIKPFEEKKKIFTRSEVNLTKAIPQRYEEWDEQSINKRQQALAKIATAIWRLS